MKNVEVIAPFIDRKTGKTIKPGDPLPASMDKDRLLKLQRAGCISIKGKIAGGGKSPDSKKNAAAKGSVADPSLFPDGDGAGNPAGSEDSGEGEDQQSGTGTDPEAMAGADSGGPGAGAEPDGAGRDAGDEQSQDDSGR